MKDRIAIVTGASRGIGRGICLEFAARGASVIACARSEGPLHELAEEATRRELAGTIEPRMFDVCSRDAVDPLVESVSSKHERIDILVNNAGITRDGLMMSMDDDQFDEVLTTNLRSVFWLTRAVSRVMVRQRYGRIVNVGSVSGEFGNAGQSNYVASKAGLSGFTKSIAKEFGKRKITCNVVAPGFIETDMTAGLSEEIKTGAKKMIPLARFGTVEEVARVVAFLAGDDAAYITGQVLVVDGGLNT